MRILSRYILRETLWHASIGLGVFTFVLFMGRVGEILEIVVRNSAPLPSVAQLLFLALPTALTVTIPMAVLVGILIGLSRMAADSEVTAMRASGFGLGSFLRPVAVLAVAACLLAAANTLFLAPRSAAALSELQDQLKSSQASFEVEPHVFYEQFPKMVLYVEDVLPQQGMAVWKKIFLADVSDPASPVITVAQEGAAESTGQDSMALHLSNGYIYETPVKQPDQSYTRGFQDLNLAVPLPPSNLPAKGVVPAQEMSSLELYRKIHELSHEPGFRPDSEADNAIRWRWYSTELNRRLALPISCLVLALVGIPLGLSAKKGGKATGFVLTIGLVFLYYFLLLGGAGLGRVDKVSPGLGSWMANIVFFIAGLVLLWRARSRPAELNFEPIWLMFRRIWRHSRQIGEDTKLRLLSRRRRFGAGFPQILDDYILRDFALYLGLVTVTFLILALVFSFFDLFNDIVRNKVAMLTVAEYLATVVPSSFYLLAPLAVLLAVLITFGQMEKANEMTAMKASGISIYRAVAPVLALTAALAVGLFFFNEYYLPPVNRQQEELRNTIKGRPAQTFLRPDRMWIFGKNSTVYYYEYFDAENNRFGNISVFEFDPDTLSLRKRIYADNAHWEPNLKQFIFESGWMRLYSGETSQSYQPFQVATFPELREQPDYFKKEIKQYTEMSSGELSRYIHDMEQAGFDVGRLRVEWQEKFSYPLITFVMAILAVPFSMRAARRGALAGVAVALGIAISYFVISRLFEAMGNVDYLPPLLAAWAPDLFFGFTGAYMVLRVST